ncbi:CLUMA_CG019309, isoform A [Clunio marinus]|uniref:CLUMA_CG019309, isoform A n=1 Tax=Clunio marinus TaxID=568069 RepID=A0A1J1J326_9DIPT|nr:CLUMA_CG019309, isoform A [Clunio marinus]
MKDTCKASAKNRTTMRYSHASTSTSFSSQYVFFKAIKAKTKKTQHKKSKSKANFSCQPITVTCEKKNKKLSGISSNISEKKFLMTK